MVTWSFAEYGRNKKTAPDLRFWKRQYVSVRDSVNCRSRRRRRSWEKLTVLVFTELTSGAGEAGVTEFAEPTDRHAVQDVGQRYFDRQGRLGWRISCFLTQRFVQIEPPGLV
jgi:hypothetical protein